MERRFSYDVAVIGGGPAGVAAAVGAAQSGAKTILIERNPYLGGQGTNSNVTAFCGFHSRGNPPTQVVAGVGEQVLEKLRSLGQDTTYWVSPSTGNSSIRFHPELLKLALETLVQESGSDLLFHAVLVDVKKTGTKIEEIICADDEGYFSISAKAFVDTTGDANLCNLAGCRTLWGNGENPPQQAGLVVRMDRIPADVDTTPNSMAQAIVKAKEAGMEYLYKEKGFMIRIDGADTGYLTTPSATLTDLDARTLTKMELDLRKQAHSYVKALQNHLDGMQESRMVSTGPSMGIRESRRVVGVNSITKEDVFTSKKTKDTIARGGWSPEIHVNNDVTYSHLEDQAWFDIPIGSIKSADADNLWCAGRNISCDSVAQASVRVMGTCFATGHGAGVAAALTLDNTEYDYEKIHAELHRQNALLEQE